MIQSVLVETGFLLALNPRDKHHKWAMNVLEDAKKKQILLHISPAAFIELSLILKSLGRGDDDVYRVLNSIQIIINRYTQPHYPLLELKHIMYAAKLRTKYSSLTFFDSIHASLAILNKLIYYDLDTEVRKVVTNEAP